MLNLAAVGQQAFPDSTTAWEVSGIVTTGSGPAKDFRVTITGPESIKPTRTDEQGRYVLRGSTPGVYSLRVHRRDNTSEPAARSLTMGAGARLKVNFAVPKSAVLTGRVVDRDGNPVAGMSVMALSSRFELPGQMEMAGADRTNDSGDFRIPFLPEGAYLIAASGKEASVSKRPQGWTGTSSRSYPAMTFYPGVRELEAAALLEVHAGEERSGVDIVLRKEPAHCVTFRVGASFPAGRTYVSLESKSFDNPPAMARGSATANETYMVCGLVAGSYRLHVASVNPEPFRLDAYGTANADVSREDVDLGTVQPSGVADVSGDVELRNAAAGTPVPNGIRVRLVPKNMDVVLARVRPAEVNPNGKFTLKSVISGEYSVAVDAIPPGYYVLDILQLGRSVVEGGVVPINGDLRIVLGADGSSIRGRVIARDSSAVPDTTVILVPDATGGRPLVFQTDQTGSYAFAAGVPPGSYRIAAISDLPAWRRRDPAILTEIAKNGIPLSLGARDSRVLDLEPTAAH